MVTSGGLNTGPRRDTVEGVEHNFAVSYLGRFLLVNRLIPLLLKYVMRRKMRRGGRGGGGSEKMIEEREVNG